MVNETADYINLAANGALHGNIVSHPILIRLLGVYVPFHGVEFTPAFDVRSIFADAFVMSSEAWVVECTACKCVLTCFAVDPLANSANTALMRHALCSLRMSSRTAFLTRETAR